MKKVLHLERKFCSKTETFIVNQISYVKNYDIEVLTLKNLKNFDIKANVQNIAEYDKISGLGKFITLKTKKRILNYFYNKKFELIHCHYITDALVFSSITKKIDVPKIISCYGYDVNELPYSFFGIPKIFYKKIYEEYDYFLAMSEVMKEQLIKIGCPENKIIIYYHGIDTERFLNNSRIYNKDKSNISISLLTVASLEKIKGHYYIIKALEIIRNKYNFSNFKYYIVGDGPELSKLKKLTKELNLTENINFVGYIKHFSKKLVNFYEKADIFIHPSITLKNTVQEGIPGTIVEAMSNGLPVISTIHGGIPTIIKNKEDGILVKERDTEELAEKIMELISNAELRERLGKNAQKKAVNELDIKIKTKELEKIYDKAIKNYELKSNYEL